MSAQDSPTYCKLSHVSLAVQNEGDVCVCNKNTQSFEDGKKNKLYLHEAGLERMWRSPTRKLICVALDHGKRIPSCQACWDDEDAGVKSTRQAFNEKLADVEPLPEQPRILILKPTNTCNMACRMCQPNTSTSLYQDFYQVDQELKAFDGSFKDYTQQFESIRLGLGRQNTDIWTTFEQWLPNFAVLDIYGGEPLLAPAMWERMIAVADQGQAKDVGIQFHTNGTIWNDDYVRILPEFKHVQIAVSIDSHIKEQLQYIRHRVDVDALYKNLERYIALSKEHSNITVNICFTVSVYNIWYADAILTEFAKHGVSITTNVVYGPDQYDFRHLPIEVKQMIIERFTGNTDCEKLVSLLNFTVPGCDIWWPRLWKEVHILDRIRNQSFADTFPEYYQALLPYIPNEPS
jgi:organic radical activating enzyme